MWTVHFSGTPKISGKDNIRLSVKICSAELIKFPIPAGIVINSEHSVIY